MKKLVLGLGVLAALTACNARQAPVNTATGFGQPINTQFGRMNAAESNTEGHADAFARKLANPAGYKFSMSVGASSICGDKDDLQNIEDYDGTRGPSQALAAAASPSVGALAQGPAGPNSRKFCSGTLIADNLFITASHCVDGDIKSSFAVFNYQYAKGTKTLRDQAHVAILEVVEDGGYRTGLDYSIIKLGNLPNGQAPGQVFGYKKVSAENLVPKQPVFDVQHPSGKPKMVDGGLIAGVRGQNYVTYEIMDTHPGSSGSGVLNAAGNLVAVHTNGGCRTTGGENAGVPVSLIVKESKVLQSLL